MINQLTRELAIRRLEMRDLTLDERREIVALARRRAARPEIGLEEATRIQVDMTLSPVARALAQQLAYELGEHKKALDLWLNAQQRLGRLQENLRNELILTSLEACFDELTP